VGQVSSPTAETITTHITPVKLQDDCGDDPPYLHSQSERFTGAQSAPDSDCDTDVDSESEASKAWQRYLAAPDTDTEDEQESQLELISDQRADEEDGVYWCAQCHKPVSLSELKKCMGCKSIKSCLKNGTQARL
jgi:hypothetical protein